MAADILVAFVEFDYRHAPFLTALAFSWLNAWFFVADGPMLRYWRAMWRVRRVDPGDWLQLGTRMVDAKTRNVKTREKLFVRAVYEPFAKAVFDALAQGLEVVISGTPGVGKTAFRNYLVYECVQRMKRGEGPFRTIVLDSTPGDTVVVLKSSFWGLPWLQAWTFGRWRRLLPSIATPTDPSVLYIVDVSDGNSQDRLEFQGGQNILISSPSESAWHSYMKQNPGGGRLLWMPLWKEDELIAAVRGTRPDLREEQLEELWMEYGGVLRAVVDIDYGDEIQRDLGKLDWSECTRALSTATATHKVRHRLVYFGVVDDGSFKHAALRFGTDELMVRAADGYREHMRDAVDSVMASVWPGVTPGVKGDFLEAVVHRSICFARTVWLRRLGHRSTALVRGSGAIEFGLFEEVPVAWTWFKDVDEAVAAIGAALVSGEPTYLRPVPNNFPAVDSVIVVAGRVMLLQVTAASRHPIVGRDAVRIFKRLIAAAPRGRASLLWQVPASQFRTFTQQAIEGVTAVPQYAVKL